MFTCLRPRFLPSGGWIRRFCWPGSLCTLATLVQPIRCTNNTTKRITATGTRGHLYPQLSSLSQHIDFVSNKTLGCYSTHSHTAQQTRCLQDAQSQRERKRCCFDSHTGTQQGTVETGVATLSGFSTRLHLNFDFFKSGTFNLRSANLEMRSSLFISLPPQFPLAPTDWYPMLDAQFDQREA